jgi:hypothetical protein
LLTDEFLKTAITMGKIENISIELEKPLYKVGETVNGNVIVKVREAQKLNFIKLVASGHASANWYEKVNCDRNFYISMKKLFHFFQVIWQRTRRQEIRVKRSLS